MRNSQRLFAAAAGRVDMFGLTDQQKELQSTVEGFVKAEIAPIADEVDRKNEFPQVKS